MNAEDSGVEGRRVKWTKAGAVVLVAAVVVLSALFSFYYIQANDYHDAKYRSQWVLVYDLWSTALATSELCHDITGLTNGTLEYRALWGQGLLDDLGSMGNSAWAIREMYLNDEARNDTFYSLWKALDAFESRALQVVFPLWDNVTQGTPFVENSTANAQMTLAYSIFGGLHGEFDKAFKVDPYQDYGASWEREPYSLVDRLDLQSIKDYASQLDSLL